MIQDREIQIREEYDRILYQKLSEQYEAFVKFSNDQLQRRFEVAAAPSCKYFFLVFTIFLLINLTIKRFCYRLGCPLDVKILKSGEGKITSICWGISRKKREFFSLIQFSSY